ncbi:MAG: S41 family peptidase [Granulosicoccus sp.]
MPLNSFAPSYAYATALVVATLTLSGCGVRGDSAGDSQQAGNADGSYDLSQPLTFRPTARNCELEDINSWVYQSMQDYYLFYRQVPGNVNTASYESPESLIADLRVAPNDTFSYVTDETTYSAFFDEGESFGYGWNFARTADNTLLFSLIEPNSPLAIAGVQRGDELIAINGIDIPDLDQLSQAELDDIFGVDDEIKTLELTIAEVGASSASQVSVTKSRYELQTVLDTRVIEQNGVKVGYLHFYQFVNTSSQELEQAFSTFEAAGVSELVVDLRFNGGGRISVANELASHIIGDNHKDDVFTTFAFNDKYEALNDSLNFQEMQSSVSLNRVFVLQSGNTCSASELIVNSLRPFMEVITVGSNSCGKPYATTPNIACGKVVNALEIELLNAAGAGGYFDGIAADCPVATDVRRPLGELSEPLLATALNYIETGRCNLMAQRAAKERQTLSNEFKPSWQGGGSL